MLKTLGSGAPVSGLLLAASIATTTPDAFAQPDSRYVSHAGPCSRTSACLQNGWFDVSVRVYDPGADAWTTAGFAEVDVGHEAALVYFFSATNLEMLVKVLDGNAVNGRFWVFAAAATDLGFQLRVRDTETGWTNEYHNPIGTRPLAVTDTDAFVHDGRRPPTDPTDPDPPPGRDGVPDGPSRFGPGLHRVGSAIQPGRYYANPDAGCYWERRSDGADDLDGVIANEFLGGNHAQEIVDVASTDRYFTADEDCRRWSGSYRFPLGGSVAPGKWLVGTQLTPGTWEIRDNVASGLCYWARLRGFGGELDDIIDNELVEAGEEVVFLVGEDDIGFELDADCFRDSSALMGLERVPDVPRRPTKSRKNIEKTLSIREALRRANQ